MSDIMQNQWATLDLSGVTTLAQARLVAETHLPRLNGLNAFGPKFRYRTTGVEWSAHVEVGYAAAARAILLNAANWDLIVADPNAEPAYETLDLSGVTTETEARALIDEYVSPLHRSHGGWGFGWPLVYRWRTTGERAEPNPMHRKQSAVESILRHAPHWDLEITRATAKEQAHA